ncbi:MAG: hypothetical protein ACFFD1_15905, partial [Candidatus Thorarchaeota archaeon]
IINSFNQSYKNNNKQIIVPTYSGQRGNPVIFSSYYKSEIINHKGKQGCKGVVKHNSEQVLELSMENDHILRDIDTIDDYEKFNVKSEINY